MSYTVYNTRTNRLVRVFNNERSAKISCAAWKRNWKHKGEDFAVMESAEFNEKFNQKVAVKNLLSGEEVLINQQDVGTCVDPSTETYWSM